MYNVLVRQFRYLADMVHREYYHIEKLSNLCKTRPTGEYRTAKNLQKVENKTGVMIWMYRR